MALHFAIEEFDRRKQKTIKELNRRGLDGLLMFRRKACIISVATTAIAEPSRVFFLHMILMNSGSNHAMCFGHTVVVPETGCESLSKRSLDLVVR